MAELNTPPMNIIQENAMHVAYLFALEYLGIDYIEVYGQINSTKDY